MKEYDIVAGNSEKGWELLGWGNSKEEVIQEAKKAAEEVQDGHVVQVIETERWDVVYSSQNN